MSNTYKILRANGDVTPLPANFRLKDPETDEILFDSTHDKAESDKGVVYFIQAVNGGPIKIGYTTNLPKRLRSLQTAHPYELRILYSMIGGVRLESALHKTLDEHALHGEWFSDVPAVHEQIEKLRAGIMPSTPSAKFWNDKIGGGIIDEGRSYVGINNVYRLCDVGLAGIDLVRAFKLRETIMQDTNIIGKSGEAFTLKDIAALFGIVEKKAQECLARMAKCSIIARLKSGDSVCYAFNPLYGNACRKIPREIYDLFGISA